MDVERRKKSIATLSVISNSLLVVGKLFVGLLIGSVSVLSEAIHSGVDLIAALIAYFAVSHSGKPSDDKHPFGHGKLENLSGAIEALLIFVAAIMIIWEAVERLIHPQPLDQVGWGIGVMLISSLVNLYVSRKLFKVGTETHSMALIADAWHLKTDVWTAAGVMVGLALIWAGEEVFTGVHFHWVDPVAAIVVALMIFHAAYKLTVESVKDLMDVRLTDDEVNTVREVIEEHRREWCEYHDLRTRKSGAIRFVEFHLLVSPDLSVKCSHDLTDLISERIVARLPDADITIHVEPCERPSGHGAHFDHA